jgi:hypothetical protein
MLFVPFFPAKHYLKHCNCRFQCAEGARSTREISALQLMFTFNKHFHHHRPSLRVQGAS